MLHCTTLVLQVMFRHRERRIGASLVQALVPEGAVEDFDEGVVRQLAQPGEADPRAVVVGPEIDEPAGELRAVVREQVPRCPSLPHETVQHLNHVLAPQPLTDLDGQALATEHVDDRQRTELLPVAQPVLDEVQAPTTALASICAILNQQ